MTTDELRRELDRIAGSAPAIELPGDTWRRARRSVVRDRAAMVVAGAAVVVGVAGVVAWLPDDADPPVAAGPAGVPARIQNAPTYFTGQDLDDLTYSGDIETALDIGRAAVAYATEEGVPVVVDAASGEYHFLALPGFAGIFAAMELSPDGQHLAYSYADPAAQERNSDPMPTGVRIVDLETGDLRDVPLQGGMGVSVHDVSWSPGGTWLIWAGSRTTDWDSGGVGSSGGSLLGVVAPGAAVSQLVDPVDRQYMAAAVSDEGEVLLASANWTALQGLGEPVVHTVAKPSRSLNRVVFASFTDVGVAVITANPNGYGYRIREDFADGYAPNLGYGRAVGPPAQSLDPIGWTDPGQLLVRTGPEVEDNGSTPASSDEDLEKLSQLAILDVESSELTVIGSVESGTPAFTVATSLVGPDRPAVERPAQAWPFEWTDARVSLAVGAGVAAAVAVLMGLRRGWRRYRAAR